MSNDATRLKPSDVEALVDTTTFHRSPSGKAIICEIMTHSGYSAIGVARVVDLDNDAEERGKDAAKQKAMTEIWDYAAVVMQERMHTGQVQNRNKEIIADYIKLNGGQPRLI
jgi:hypothetical protein